MANHEQEGVSGGDDWLAEAMGAEGATAAPAVESEAPQGTGESESVAEAPEAGAATDPSGDTQPEIKVDSTGRAHGPGGRFVPKSKGSEPPAQEAEPPKQVEKPVEAAAKQQEVPDESGPEKDDDSKVPSWRVRELREKASSERARADAAEQRARDLEAQFNQQQRAFEAMQRQLQQIQNPPKQPDPINLFDDQGPERFVETVEERLARQEREFQQQLRNVRLETNFAMTHQLNPDVFPQAYQEFEKAINSGDRAVGARVFNSPNPGAALVSWYKEQQAIREIGTDPQSYIQRKLDEALDDPQFLARALEKARAKAGGQSAVTPQQAQPAPRPNTVVKRPPSLSGVPGGESAHAASLNSTGDWLREALGDR